MNHFERLDEEKRTEGAGHYSYPLLSESNGCTGGCCSGVSVYFSDEYNPPGVHDDQEGFFVLEGSGRVRLGDEEFPILPGISFVAPPGVPHSIKKDDNSGPVKVFWFHAAK